MAIITVATALLISFICLSITTTTACPTNKKSPPTSIFGICTKIGTFHIPSVENPPEEGSIKMLTQEYTKVRWRVSEGRIVVKFKVGLEKLCKNLAKTMGNVKGDLKRMLFWKKRVQQIPSVKSAWKYSMIEIRGVLGQKFPPGKEDVRGATVYKFFIYPPLLLLWLPENHQCGIHV